LLIITMPAAIGPCIPKSITPIRSSCWGRESEQRTWFSHPPCCLIGRCYPDGAIADDDPMSIDRPAKCPSRLARREGSWARRALHSPSRPQPRAMGRRSPSGS
jgi:hypothetical protein